MIQILTSTTSHTVCDNIRSHTVLFRHGEVP